MPAHTPRISVASPTGQQWRIGHGRQEVIVCEVGATLRAYTVGDDRRSSTASAPTSGRTRAGARSRALAQPPGRRPLRVQRGAGPGRARRAGAPQRHPRPGALDALDAPDPAPEPALPAAAAPPLARLPVLPPPRARVPRGPGRPDRHDQGAVARGGPDPLRHRLPPLPDRGARDGRRGDPARAGAPHPRRGRPGAPDGRADARSRAPTATSPRRASSAPPCSTRPTRPWSGTPTAWPGPASMRPAASAGATLWVDARLPLPHGVHGRHAAARCNAAGAPSPSSP